jgi:hypothetical protein
MTRLYTFSRFAEPDDIEKPLTKCACCESDLYEGFDIVRYDGEIFCDKYCLLDYLGVTTEVLDKEWFR